MRLPVGLILIGGRSPYSIKIGRLPAGAIITAVSTTRGNGNHRNHAGFQYRHNADWPEIASAVALTAGSLNSLPLAALVMPLVADTDVYANVSGTATGDAYVMIRFFKLRAP